MKLRMLCKILLLSLLTLTSFRSYAQNAWGKEVFLDIREKPLRDALAELRKQTDLNLIFNDNLTKEKLLTLNINSTAEKAMTELLSSTGFTYKKFDDNSAVIFEEKPKPPKTKAVVKKSNLKINLTSEKAEIIKPTLISKLELIYPKDAVDKQIEGEVLAKILVSSKGDVSRVKLEKSSGHQILDTATINYVQKLKFLPAELNGKYKDVWTTMVVKYQFEYIMEKK